MTGYERVNDHKPEKPDANLSDLARIRSGGLGSL
jgi:hypothetical protein